MLLAFQNHHRLSLPLHHVVASSNYLLECVYFVECDGKFLWSVEARIVSKYTLLTIENRTRYKTGEIESLSLCTNLLVSMYGSLVHTHSQLSKWCGSLHCLTTVAGWQQQLISKTIGIRHACMLGLCTLQ